MFPHLVHFTLEPFGRKRLSSSLNLLKQAAHSMTIAL
jgi:hypothetical protein